MPVKFHPNNPVSKLEEIIIKENGNPLWGEIDIYKKINEDLSKSDLDWDVWHDLKLPQHSDNCNYYKKTSAQIDFLILCKYGMIVLEVKGGSVSTKDNIFYYDKIYQDRIKQNPFKQAEGYKFTLKDNILNNFKDCFFCYVVAFPHVDYPFETILIDNKLLWTKYTASNYDNSIESFLISALNYSKNKHLKHFRTYNDITPKQLISIQQTLSPTIADRNHTNTINRLEWLGINNIEILEGLYKNSRIMIEGPPGSGKTTIAKAFIDMQGNKKGIYICWNDLLIHYMKSVLNDRLKSNNLEVTTFFKFILKHNTNIGYNQLINYNEQDFYKLVKKTISRLEIDENTNSYSYIVIDEAQDTFDRGIDLFINSFSGYNGNGLTNGNSLILYDIDQSYSYYNRDVSVIADLMTKYYSHFKLSEIKRSSQNPDIRKLAIKILDQYNILSDDNFNNNFPNIPINYFQNLIDLKNHIVKKILTPIRDKKSSLYGRDCIILIESTFLKGQYRGNENLKELLIIRDIDELTNENINDSENKLKYTSILKYKGLEKKNVYLIISKPCERNNYELYIGITRAILNLEINIVE